MTLIPSAPVILAYNGVTFDACEIMEIDARPVPDSAGRTIKFIHYTLTVHATIGSVNQFFGVTTDPTLSALRVLLTQYGGELHVEASGFGPVILNVPPDGPTVGSDGKAQDAEWGPKPTMLRWKPLGQFSAEVDWTVEFRVAECPDPTQGNKGILEWCFSLSYNVDKSGYTTRTYKGHVSIPQTRTTVASRTLVDQADRLRESINPPLVLGFRRIYGPFELDESKCKLDWSITDEEIGPNYPPPGVIEVSMNHTTHTQNLAGLFFGGAWEASLDATYELSRDVQRSVAAAYFFAVLVDRMSQANKSRMEPASTSAKIVAGFAMLTGFRASEPEIYGRRGASFTATWRYFTSLKNLVLPSGLWRAVPNSDWQQWAVSLARTAFNCRGNAQLRFDPASDAIIDLCLQNNYVLRPGGSSPSYPARPTSLDTFRNPVPPPETSWIAYKSSLRLEQDDPTVIHQPLPTQLPPRLQYGVVSSANSPDTNMQSNDLEGAKQATGGGIPVARVSTIASYPDSLAPPAGPSGPIIQVRGAPTWYAYLEGYAMRAGFPIQPPTLLSVGGQTAVPANRKDCGEGFRQWLSDSFFGLNVHAAMWRLRYVLTGKPSGEIPVMDTPWAGW